MTKTQGFVSPCMADSHQECSYVTKKKKHTNDFEGDRPLQQLLKDYQAALAGWRMVLKITGKSKRQQHWTPSSLYNFTLSAQSSSIGTNSVFSVNELWCVETMDKQSQERLAGRRDKKQKKKKKCKSDS